MKKVISITDVSELKSGSTNGKDWTLSKISVEEEDVKQFTTFNGDTYASKIGQQVEVDINQVVNGKFKNWQEVTPKSARAQAADEQLLVLKDIRNLLKEILDASSIR